MSTAKNVLHPVRSNRQFYSVVRSLGLSNLVFREGKISSMGCRNTYRTESASFSQSGTWNNTNIAITLIPSYKLRGITLLTNKTEEVIWTPGKIHDISPVLMNYWATGSELQSVRALL